jgi:hypothetical protein
LSFPKGICCCFVVTFASEIGQGFSLGIETSWNLRFSAREMLSFRICA